MEKTGEYDDEEDELDNKIPSSSTNLFRERLFRIFGNLKELIIFTSWGGDIYSFNIFQLLSILEEVEFPKSFKTIIIKDGEGIWESSGWLKSVFSKQIEKTFALKNLEIKLQTGQGSDEREDWMVINVV
eukprot:722445_1